MLAIFLAALATFLLAALLYFRGWFRPAGLVGLAFGVAVSMLVLQGFGPIGGGVLVVLFVLAPAAFLVVHAYDARRGVFLLPTIYSIPLAFACGALLLLLGALALLAA